jgi:hypothetical protein
MEVKIIEGVEYVLKTDIENAMKDRISKLTARATDAEKQLEAMQTQVEAVANLEATNKELQAKLDATTAQYERHNALAQNGFIEPDIRDAVEWAYERATKGQDKPQTLVEWIQDIKADPTNAPAILRPHLQTSAPKVEAAPNAPKVEAVQATEQQAVQDDAPAVVPPKTNTGAQPHPTQKSDILSMAAKDIEFYRANRDAIRKAWHNR